MEAVGNWNNHYEQKRYDYNLNSSSIVLDFGAYTGQWAKNIINKFNCKVYCYEAVKEYYNNINHKNIISYNCAITCKDGFDYIHICDEGSSMEELSEYKKKNDLDVSYQNNIIKFSNIPLERVETKDVNSVLNEFQTIDLLKINIEGAEYDILNRMCITNTISKIQNIQIQFHNFVDEAQYKYDNTVKLLQKTHKCDFNSMWRWSFWSKK